MPIYDYSCKNCGNVFERFAKIGEKVGPCPLCSSEDITLVPSVFRAKAWNPQFVRDIQDKPIFVRNRNELRDSINKFNDSELASIQGKVAVYED